MAIDKALYTAHATSTGGRTGTTQSNDGAIKLALVTPKELGGSGADADKGTNPEQLFAAGYSACFIGAIASCDFAALLGPLIKACFKFATIKSTSALVTRKCGVKRKLLVPPCITPMPCMRINSSVLPAP